MDRLFHNVVQGSDLWFQLRLGQITSSNFACIMANYGKAFGEPAKKYAMRVAIESITGKRLETYSNGFMERGIELEPFARDKYEETTGKIVNPGGFMEYGRFGDSIDGLIDDKGGIEIKSVLYNTHFKRLLEGGIDNAYKWQVQGHIWIHDLDYCDWVSFCPEFPKSKSLYIFRVERNDSMISQMEERLEKFVKLVDEYKRAVGVEHEEPESIVIEEKKDETKVF